MVQPQPDEIINGTNAIINALRELRSPSPNAGGFSRFSSRATTLNNAVPGPSSQYPVYSYPPPPPPPPHRWGCIVSRGLAPVRIRDNPPPISKTGSVCGASCRGAEPQYHQNINKKLGLYSVGNGLPSIEVKPAVDPGPPLSSIGAIDPHSQWSTFCQLAILHKLSQPREGSLRPSLHARHYAFEETRCHSIRPESNPNVPRSIHPIRAETRHGTTSRIRR